MKKYIYITIALFASLSVSAQTLYTTRHDSIPATGDSISLQSAAFRGTLQWQRSDDGKTWSNLVGKTNSLLKIPASTEAFYRANVIEDTCFETFTDTAVVLLPKAQIKTIDPKTGISETLLKSDSTTFYYKSTGQSALKLGSVLIKNDSVSEIRIVTSITQKGDTLAVQTTQGTMGDLFVNQSFKLSTATASNAQSITGLTRSQLSRVLTDANGFIHPASIIDNNPSAKKINSMTTQTDNISHVSFGKDFSGDYIYNEGGLALQFTEGYYKFDSELKCEFDFEQPKFDLAKLRITGGNLKRFSFYTDPDVTGIDAKLILLAKAGGATSFEKEKILAKNIFNKSFKFFVGDIPVWMDVTIDLMTKATGALTSELSVSGGASASAHASLGVTYENGAWKPIQTFTKTLTLEGPTINGKANETLKVEIYPHISLRFYKIIGPYLDIAPYAREAMNLSISGNSDFSLYAGVNARLGISVGAFDKNVLGYSHEFNLKEEILYQTPKKLKLISGGKQEGTPGVALTDPIVLRVLDSKDNTVANYPVNLSGLTGCSVSATQNTDYTGEVQVKWTLDTTEGENKLEAYLKDGKDEKITIADTIITATCKTSTPIVTTGSVSNITKTTVTCGGTITKNRGAAVTARGVCWNTTGNPTTANSKTTDGDGDGIFASYLTELTAGTTYYVRAYATNSKGTGYGNEICFKTVCETDIFTDNRDGHIYKWVRIGDQIWMAENLNYATTGSYFYNNDSELGTIYGRLYTYGAALNACPTGWHLPSFTEWQTLSNYLGGDAIAGGKLKETGTTHWNTPNTDATNEFCFSALPAGARDSGAFYNIRNLCRWWTSTENASDLTTAFYRGLSYSQSKMTSNYVTKTVGFSVRCIKN